MISIDIDKTMADAKRLRQLSSDADETESALAGSQSAYREAWQGNAGSDFQELADRTRRQISSFSAEAVQMADILTNICSEFEAADK